MRRTRLTILISLVTAWMGYAQTPDVKEYKIEGHHIVLLLERSMPREQQENLLKETGMEGLSLDTLWKFGSIGQWKKHGWKLATTGSGYKIYKSLADLSGDLHWNKTNFYHVTELASTIREQVTASFGFNLFKKNSVITAKGTTRFFLSGHQKAREVFLSGTFNEWSTLRTHMTQVDSGWVASVPLQPGKHCYKFIVDGRWMEDPVNYKREEDGQGGFNSVYFVTNYEFTLSGYTQNRNVILAGSFNNWNERELRMYRTASGWRVPVYLKDGIYEYKFIVDGNWIIDPANTNMRDDGKGNTNSYVQLGRAVTFTLPGFKNARTVILAGEFNGWNETELVMKKTGTGWEVQHVLGPGNYQYKYIVDGEWFTDPTNPHVGSLNGHINSVMVVKPNYTFVLNKFPDARSVYIAGNFTYWSGYSMKKTPDGWVMPAYLPVGKYLYKFIVNGKWIIDPDNAQWEQNEHGDGNSVLWINPGK